MRDQETIALGPVCEAKGGGDRGLAYNPAWFGYNV